MKLTHAIKAAFERVLGQQPIEMKDNKESPVFEIAFKDEIDKQALEKEFKALKENYTIKHNVLSINKNAVEQFNAIIAQENANRIKELTHKKYELVLSHYFGKVSGITEKDSLLHIRFENSVDKEKVRSLFTIDDQSNQNHLVIGPGDLNDFNRQIDELLLMLAENQVNALDEAKHHNYSPSMFR
ncbi:Uncharacterised protein [Legionella donaldsonii]|uniref:Uncharacterized protein n=1 Tax=Legionella donaldsonii TaxID=45060 RepID=A0A378J2X0_9GAMM|nr:hypothetical protein [Legionella donaldsonii]STX41869.1 Uncharacterised protein [Legionella donaldsonii]